MNKYLLGLLLLGGFFSLQAQVPDDYEAKYQAALDKWYILKYTPGNDVVIDPIETIPMAYDASSQNYAKKKYNFPYVKSDHKIFIFVVDTEGKITHPDLKEGYCPEYDKSFTGESVLSDVNGHGIHCLGIIVSKQEGLLYDYVKAGNIDFAVVKALRNEGSGSFGQIYSSGEYIAKVAPLLYQRGYSAVFANFSLGASGTSVEMERMTTLLKKAGVYTFAAAGNTGNYGVGTPANTAD